MGPSLDVHIRWANETGLAQKCSELLPSLIYWLDEWLDENAANKGLANVRCENLNEGVALTR